MQAQTKINQEVAVALEHLNGLMQSTLDRVKTLEDARHNEEARRENRSDQRFEIDRATVALVFTAIITLLNLWPHLHLS